MKNDPTDTWNSRSRRIVRDYMSASAEKEAATLARTLKRDLLETGLGKGPLSTLFDGLASRHRRQAMNDSVNVLSLALDVNRDGDSLRLDRKIRNIAWNLRMLNTEALVPHAQVMTALLPFMEKIETAAETRKAGIFSRVALYGEFPGVRETARKAVALFAGPK